MVARELSLSKKIQIFRELSLNTEVNLMVHVMFLHHWADNGNQEILFLMVHVMFPHHWTDNGNQETLFQQGDRGLHGDEERRQEEKKATQLCNTAHVHSATC